MRLWDSKKRTALEELQKENTPSVQSILMISNQLASLRAIQEPAAVALYLQQQLVAPSVYFLAPLLDLPQVCSLESTTQRS